MSAAVLNVFTAVFPDIAPSPAFTVISLFPAIFLVAAVVLLAGFLLKKFFFRK